MKPEVFEKKMNKAIVEVLKTNGFSCCILSKIFYGKYDHFISESNSNDYKLLFRPYSNKLCWLPEKYCTPEFRTTMLELYKQYKLSELKGD